MTSRLLFFRQSTLFLLLALFISPLLAAEHYAVKVERDVSAKMRDGVALRADIYRPDADGKFPVLLQRTPYNKSGWSMNFAYLAAARGYVVVIQDVRGRYTSEGDWYPFIHEAEDGYDTVEWVAALPYSDGKVGMFGGSYVGATQMLAATAHPPHLAGICPVVTASNYHDGWTYQGGAFEQWFDESWGSALAQDTLNRSVQKATNARIGEDVLPLTTYPLFNLPAPGVVNASTPSLAPYFLDWLAHPAYDDYWKRLNLEDHYPDIRVPALHIAAWYDIFLGGSLRNLRRPESARRNRRSPQRPASSGHHRRPRRWRPQNWRPRLRPRSRKIRGKRRHPPLVRFPLQRHAKRIRYRQARHDFRHGPQSMARGRRLAARSRQEHPVFSALAGRRQLFPRQWLSFHLRPRFRARGQVHLRSREARAHHRWPALLRCRHLAPGPKDQRALEERNDVLIYSTPSLEHDLEVTGPVRLEFFASSSAVDTDFTAKLVDVYPDGSAINIAEGILRAKYRDSQETSTLLTPGKVYSLAIDLWATSNVFRAGHRIRLEVSSSNFPRFDRNLNTGESAATSPKWASATNTILHDAAHPSALLLPVVP